MYCLFIYYFITVLHKHGSCTFSPCFQCFTISHNCKTIVLISIGHVSRKTPSKQQFTLIFVMTMSLFGIRSNCYMHSTLLLPATLWFSQQSKQSVCMQQQDVSQWVVKVLRSRWPDMFFFCSCFFVTLVPCFIYLNWGV